ncbi:methionine--tRNA ligase [Candidatus Parcubacteria bacterium]|jgi:methionyl-tRNA synthetase|nr:MAG: methionine--tRNA ligase [Candidatus Parcubacteria bacterium]
MEKNNFYITTTLPYVNAKPHMGHALEFVQADVIARYQKLLGKRVFFNTGTDEHGQKIYTKANEVGLDPQAYADEYAEKFKIILDKLNISKDVHFIRTTDKHHKEAAQYFWNLCKEKGDIYKKTYKIKYCIGCELEKTDSELLDGVCPEHPNLVLEDREEENYFFKFSNYEKQLISFYEKYQDFVVPDFRFNEIKNFVKNGLSDFSISRLKSKMPWGVAVPDDDTQVMYVWFDALINYISTLGWPEDKEQFTTYWGDKDVQNAVQIAGKDNLRQQSAMWQAMLMSAGVPTSKQIIIHGFIVSAGQKMAKSLGNVIDPYEVIEKFGTDGLRFWLTKEMNTFEDGDFTYEKCMDAYISGLSNGLGNLVSRTMKMAQSAGLNIQKEVSIHDEAFVIYRKYLDVYEIKKAAEEIWNRISICDKKIQETEPFKLIKTDEVGAKKILTELVEQIWEIELMLRPFLPETAEKISAILKNPQNPITPLFPRIT